MRVRGTLYEITNVALFVQQYVTNRSQPVTDNISPVPNARIILDRCDQTGRQSPFLAESDTDHAGRFELDLSMSQETSLFLSAYRLEDVSEGRGGSGQQPGRWYRSSPFVPGTDEIQRDIYIARVTIPREAGFSQAELATVLAETKREVADLEWIKGRIQPNGVTLSCGGKGATASGRVVLNPDRSDDLSKTLSHSIEDFRLELPGPSWLVGLVVSKDSIEASIRAGLAGLVGEISRRLHLSAINQFAAQLQLSDPVTVEKIVSETTLSFSRLQYEVIPTQEPSKTSRTIMGEACFGFPRSLETGGTRCT